MDIRKGEQYAIPFEITVEGTPVTPEDCDGVRIQVGDRMCEYPGGDLTYDSEDGVWLYPLTEEQSRAMFPGDRKAQVAVKYGDDIVMSDPQKITVKNSIITRRWTS